MNNQMTSRLLFRLLPIQILLSAIAAVNGIVSSIFASNAVGVEAMSAVGLYNPINQLIMALNMMLVSGSAILFGKYIGKNEKDKVQNIFSLSITVGLIISVFFAVLLLFIGIFDLSGFLTADSVIRPLLNQYLIGQAIGIPAYILGGLLSSFLSLENKTRITTTASITYILVNVLFNFVFLHLFHMEALGLALASSLGMWVFFIIQARYFLTKKSSLHYSWKNLKWRDTLTMSRIGLPGAINNAYQAIRGLIVNMLLTQYVGAVGISAFTAANTLLGLAWAIPAGMLNVSRMMISISVGEEDRQTLKDTIHNALFRFIPLMCMISAALIALAVPLTTLYYQDTTEAVFQMTVWGFRILPLCMPLAIIPMHLGCYGQTTDRNLMVNLLQILDGFVTVCVFTALLIPAIGMNSVYITNVINGVVSILFLIFYSIIKNRRMPKTIEQFIVVPPDFGASEEDRMDRSLHTINDVIHLSEDILSFCRQKEIDPRRSYYAGLFMEEMAGNVVEHGFHKDKKNHTIDTRVVYKEGSIILRIKDDCIPFDPAERLKIVDPDDMTKNIGIRMVYRIADDIEYQNILGLNVLTIRM